MSLQDASANTTSLLTWRTVGRWPGRKSPIRPRLEDGVLLVPITDCRWCQTPLLNRETIQEGFRHKAYRVDQNVTNESKCPLCGWKYKIDWDGNSYGKHGLARGHSTVDFSVLRSFGLDDPDLPIDELCAHLKRRYSDVFSIPWRTFEILVADVFRTHGYSVLLTRPSKDDGADLIVYARDSSPHLGIVECKKWKEDRSITVTEVRSLVGAALDWGVRRAWLVTSAGVTRDSRKYAARLSRRGYEVSLVEGSHLLSMLDVYDDSKLPPLDILDLRSREEIVRANTLVLADDGYVWRDGDCRSE